MIRRVAMAAFDDACHDIVASGDWASEWCVEHQVARWRIAREMWNEAAKPAP